MMVSSWQMLRRGRSPTVVVEFVSRRWFKYIAVVKTSYVETTLSNTNIDICV